MQYQVIDSRTGQPANRVIYSNARAARRACDALDSRYGAIRYRVERRGAIDGRYGVQWADLSARFCSAADMLEWIATRLTRNPELRSMPLAVADFESDQPAYVLNAADLIG